MAPLEKVLGLLPRSDRMFLLPLTNDYDFVSLKSKRIEALEGRDRGLAEATKVAGKGNWKLSVVQASRVDTEESRGYYGGFEMTKSTAKIVRALGPAVKKWMPKMVNFDSAETSGDGMMLFPDVESTSDSDSDDPYSHQPAYQVSDFWGKGKTVECSGHGAYYSYENECQETTYKRYFLLAYDVTSVFELKSLQDIGEAVKQVSSSQDSDLFLRLMAVIQSKAQCKLPSESCLLLLQMVIEKFAFFKIADEARLPFAKAILASLDFADEPDQALYNLILVAIEFIGWRDLEDIVSQILDNKAREKGLSLGQCLVRVDFVFCLRGLCDGIDVDSLLTSCFDSISSSPRRTNRSETAAIIANIESMIEQHGWGQMERVVVESVASMREFHGVEADFGQVAADGLFKRTELLLKLYTDTVGCAAIESHLCDAAKDFITTLEQIARRYTPYNSTERPNKYDVLSLPSSKKLLYLLFEYGTHEEFDRFGKWASSHDWKLSMLVERVRNMAKDEAEGISLASNILNKCLLQLSTNWTKGGGERPSAHVQKILHEFPHIAMKKDGDGRIAIHHAVASGCTCLDSVKDLFSAYPKGASIADPVTGLFPFMLAGSKDDVDASFELLLADPSLVDTRFGGGKKRKRAVDAGMCM